MEILQTIWDVLIFQLAQIPVLGYIIGIVVVVVLAWVVWNIRLYMIRFRFIISKKWTTLEVRIPKEVDRSPEAMETFLNNALYQTGGIGSPYKRYWLGKVLNWASLEIVSFGGNVHFYIIIQSWLKDIVETQLYAQYPQVEIREVEDYTNRIPPYSRDSDWDFYGATYKLVEDDSYPIRTYKDSKVDEMMEKLDAEQQIDPINSLLEAMASLKPGEEWWLQYVIRANKFYEPWQQKAEKVMQKLKRYYAHAGEQDLTGDKHKATQEQEERIDAIERSLQKHTYKVGIRTMYLARKDVYDKRRHIMVKNAFSPFSSQHLNKLKRVAYTGFDHPWEDYNDFLNVRKKQRFLEEYRNREYFNLLFKFSWFDLYMKFIDKHDHHVLTLTSEELATLFHFPPRSLQAPGIERIESRKGEPPANLPM